MLIEAYLGLGSNLGDRVRNLDRARTLLEGIAEDLLMSSIYETSPQGFSAQPAFVNAACRLWTRLAPFHLMGKLQEIQTLLGGQRAFVNGPRILDLDILFYGRSVMSTPVLTIPHPRMAGREFVLAPLAEIAPGLLHPVLKVTVTNLLERLPEGVGAGRAVRLYAPRWGTVAKTAG